MASITPSFLMPNLDNNMYRLITAHVLPIMHLPTEEIEVLRPVERCMKLAISVLWRDLKEFRPKVIVFCWVFLSVYVCMCWGIGFISALKWISLKRISRGRCVHIRTLTGRWGQITVLKNSEWLSKITQILEMHNDCLCDLQWHVTQTKETKAHNTSTTAWTHE